GLVRTLGPSPKHANPVALSGADDLWRMSRSDELDARKRLAEITEHATLPGRVQMQLDLVNQHDPLGSTGCLIAKERVELSTTPSDVGCHRNEASLTVGQTIEGQLGTVVELDSQLLIIDAVVDAAGPFQARARGCLHGLEVGAADLREFSPSFGTPGEPLNAIRLPPGHPRLKQLGIRSDLECCAVAIEPRGETVALLVALLYPQPSGSVVADDRKLDGVDL